MLTGKKVLMTGLLSNKSIAYGISKAMHREGAELVFTYVNDQLKARVERLAAEFSPVAILPCDVSSDESIENLFAELKKHWQELDVIIHSIAFAPSDQLNGDFIDNVNREGFKIAHDISSYSLCAMAKASRDMLSNTASILTMSYLGAEKSVANYNTMGLAKASLEAAVRYTAASMGKDGVRVNAISAGPIRTLASAGIKGFKQMLDHNASVAPLARNVTPLEVGNVAAFLASDYASAVTGQILYVDCGFSTVAVLPVRVEA